MIASGCKITENHRRVRYYELTEAGRKQLVDEPEQWERLSNAVNLGLRTIYPAAGRPDIRVADRDVVDFTEAITARL